MCSLEHDTCANMFSSGLHKRQQSKKKKNTRVKKAQPPIRRETRCNLQCIILCNFLFASSRRSFCEKGGSLKNSKKCSTVSFPVASGWKLSFRFSRSWLTKHMLIYNPIRHKHAAAATLVIASPIHAQQAAAQPAPGWHLWIYFLLCVQQSICKATPQHSMSTQSARNLCSDLQAESIGNSV